MLVNEVQCAQCQKEMSSTRANPPTKGDRQIKSIPDQLEHCRELAQRNGLIIAPEDVFQESKSAKTPGNRPVFDHIIDLVKRDK